jgi:hypothetical protein
LARTSHYICRGRGSNPRYPTYFHLKGEITRQLNKQVKIKTKKKNDPVEPTAF